MARPGQGKIGTKSSGDHIVFIYEEPAELLAFAVPFVKEGLANGERCIYVVDDLAIKEFTDALIAGGVDVTREIERGALVLTNAKEYLQLPFDLVRVLNLKRERAQEARSRGFSGLRVAVEMTWQLKTAISDQDFVEFESLLDEALGPGTATVVCAYRRGQFSTALLQQMLRNHAKVIAADLVLVNLNGMFQELTQTDLQAFVASAEERRVPKGGLFYQQGDPASQVFVLTSGLVKIIRTDPNGRSVILRLVKPPKPFGHISAFAGTPRLATAQALEDSRALVWNASDVLNVIMHHPKVSLNAVHFMAKQISAEQDHVQDLATSPVERRLARFLLRLAHGIGRRTSEGIAIEVALSGEDLADLINTTPYTVSRIMAGWRRLNLVEGRRESFLVQDQERLAAIAGAPGIGTVISESGSKPE